MTEEQRDETITAGLALGVLAAILLVGLVVLVLLGAGPIDPPEGELTGVEAAVGGGVIRRAALGQSSVSQTGGASSQPMSVVLGE